MKILIVDDEAPIREYISYCIREAGPEFELAGCFARADKVLEYLRDGEAELLLCDITMPGMDGLELLSEVRKRHPRLETVVLTCHDDFHYARTALKGGCADYVLKSELDPVTMKQLLMKVADRKRQAEMDGRIIGYIGAAQFLREIIADKGITRVDPEDLKLHGIQPESQYFAIVFQYGNKLLNRLELNLPPWLSHPAVFTLDRGRAVLLGGVSLSGGESEISKQVQAFKDNLERLSDGTVGVSGLHHDPSALKQAFLEAIADADRRFYDGTTFMRGNLRWDPDSLRQDLLSLRNAAITAVGERNYPVYADAVKDILARVRGGQVGASFLKELLLDIVRSTPEMGEDFSGNIEKAATMDGLCKELNRFSGALMERMPRYSENISAALEHIRAHYAEDLSLQDVAGAVYLNNEYFSRRFKKEVGVNFSEYLLRLRLSQAVKLLQNTNLRVGTIADQVGIPNVSYFSLVFKKQYGVTPNEMRYQMKGEKSTK